MTKSHTLLALVVSCAAMTACGGGGSDASTPAPSPAPAGAPAPAPASALSAGSVSAAFVPGSTPGYAMFAVGSKGTGVLRTHVQQPDGAVTTLNDYSLTAAPVVLDKAGDATFAMGRWAGGTANTPSGAQAFVSNSAWHYLLYNVPAAFPASAALVCDAGNFTSPSYVGGASSLGNYFGHASGSATLAFADGKANAGITLNVEAGSIGSKTGTANKIEVGTTNIVGGSIGTGADAIYLNIGQADAGAFTVQGGYEINVANGARYTGVYRFRCH